MTLTQQILRNIHVHGWRLMDWEFEATPFEIAGCIVLVGAIIIILAVFCLFAGIGVMWARS